MEERGEARCESRATSNADEDRLICDLLSSMPMCFNLFGELACDLELADRAVHKWWPDVPGRVRDVRFEWSPGRGLPGEYLENRSAFDVVFELDLGGEKCGVLGVETKYHEHCKKPARTNYRNLTDEDATSTSPNLRVFSTMSRCRSFLKRKRSFCKSVWIIYLPHRCHSMIPESGHGRASLWCIPLEIPASHGRRSGTRSCSNQQLRYVSARLSPCWKQTYFRHVQ